MSSSKYTLKGVKHIENGEKIQLYFLNPCGGGVFLTYDGYGEPDWPSLPDDFPITLAKYIAKNGLMRF